MGRDTEGGGSYGNEGVVGRRREWDRARRPEPFLSGSLCCGTESPLHYTSSRKELWLRAGSLCVPIVESVTRRGNPPTHQERCHWQEAGLLPPLVKSQNCALSSLRLPPT